MSAGSGVDARHQPQADALKQEEGAEALQEEPEQPQMQALELAPSLPHDQQQRAAEAFRQHDPQGQGALSFEAVVAALGDLGLLGGVSMRELGACGATWPLGMGLQACRPGRPARWVVRDARAGRMY